MLTSYTTMVCDHRHLIAVDRQERSLSATISLQLFKAVLRLILQAEEEERRLLVGELKTALHRYLEPLLG